MMLSFELEFRALITLLPPNSLQSFQAVPLGRLLPAILSFVDGLDSSGPPGLHWELTGKRDYAMLAVILRASLHL